MSFGEWKSYLKLDQIQSQLSSLWNGSTDEPKSLRQSVLDICNSNAWGTSPTDMHQFISHLQDDNDRIEIMQAVRERIDLDDREMWRKVYKALILYEYLMLHGPESHLSDLWITDQQRLQRLHDFEFCDKQGKDLGNSVRVRSQEIVKLLEDSSGQLIEDARREALENRRIMLARKGGISSSNFTSNAIINEEQSVDLIELDSECKEQTEKVSSVSDDNSLEAYLSQHKDLVDL